MPIYKYQSNSGLVHPIRLAAQTFAESGGETGQDIDSSIRAKVSKTNKELGLRPRMIVIAKTFGAAPDTFSRYARIPILTLSTWNSTAYQIGSPFSHRASAGWTIINRLEEDV